MKLSGHNFNNKVFDSLLDNICKDVKLEKTAKQHTQPEFNEFLSSNTIDDLNSVQRDELDFIASELTYAANRSRIEVNAEDLAKFASQVQKENLRGKQMERAAQKFCNHIDRAIANPQGTTRMSADDLINQLSGHKVTPAGYDPNYGSNDSITGKYMGSSKNPNTIWDSGELAKQASVPLGDEKIKAGKNEEKAHRLAMKTQQWQELQDKHSDPIQVHKGITNAGTSSEDNVVNRNNPANSMSIFSDNRDFENIPNTTAGEEIIAQAEARANKKLNSNFEDRDIQKPMTTKDSFNDLFK